MLSSTVGSSRSNNNRTLYRYYTSPHIARLQGQSYTMYSNRYSYSFRSTGWKLGCLIILFAAALLSTELGRIYSGSLNRGRNDSTDAFQYLISSNVIVGFNGNILNPKPENRWIWPWSTATLLFSLVFIMTGAFGIMSAVRESYTSILTFFISIILSICLSVFLIATYATILAGWKTIYGTDRSAMPSFVRMDQDFASGCLAITCVLFIILLVSLYLSGRTIDACVRKEYPKPANQYQRFIGSETPQFQRRTPQFQRRTPQAPPTPRLGYFNELVT